MNVGFTIAAINIDMEYLGLESLSVILKLYNNLRKACYRLSHLL